VACFSLTFPVPIAAVDYAESSRVVAVAIDDRTHAHRMRTKAFALTFPVPIAAVDYADS